MSLVLRELGIGWIRGSTLSEYVRVKIGEKHG